MQGDGQNDGDGGAWGSSPFARSVNEQPWLRSSQPPWHLWGNTQQITVPIETTGAVRTGVTNTLVRIAYKRPESWHWVFQAKLLSGPNNTATFFSRVFVHFNLMTGIGRSFQQMKASGGQFPGYETVGFDDYVFVWRDPDPFPVQATIWTTQSQAPSRTFDPAGVFPVEARTPVTQIVAQDLVLEVNCVGLTTPANVAAVGQNVVLEVSAQFSPRTHVRPDWSHPDAPLESLFAGDEIGGR